MTISSGNTILSLPEIASLGCISATLIFQGKATKPDLFLLGFDDGRQPVAFKTFALKHALVRATVGWFITRREYLLLTHLKGKHGICQIIHPSSRTGLFLEWIPGKPLHRFPQGTLPDTVFEELYGIIQDMHSSGVVHLDMAHCGNILIRQDGKPVLIDFQSAFFVKNWPSWMQRLLIAIDELTVIKWKKKRFPGLLTSREQQAYALRRKMRRLWPFSH